MSSVQLALFAVIAATAGAPATQVTRDALSDPSFAPDGRQMAVVALRDGHEQIAVAAVDGDDIRLLTHDASDHEDPAWSPDGTTIAYVAKVGGGEVIHLMRANGSGDHALTPPTQRVIHPAWSADGSAVYYCTDDDLAPPRKNASDIMRIPKSGGPAVLVVTGGTNTYPAPSPDGRALAFRKMVGADNSEVWSATIDGNDARNLTNSPAFDGWPAWSPDGTRIAFASNPAGNHKIYIMARDGSDVRLVADTAGRGTAPRWSRDGGLIYFTICARVAGVSRCEIYRAPAS